ncbi:MAG: hypothetical protein ACO3XP_09315, partial [Ilumatobacteraceae bacterium]
STAAGIRVVDLVEQVDDQTVMLSVSMGLVSPLDEPEHWSRLECHPDRPVRHLSLGNPHSVVGVDDVDAVDLVDLGQRVPHINLEIVAPGPEPDAITMRVHERGVGITQACGTGACAAAEAALTWGLVAQSAEAVTVHMPGGDALVQVNRDTTEAILTGPAVFIGDVMVHL